MIIRCLINEMNVTDFFVCFNCMFDVVIFMVYIIKRDGQNDEDLRKIRRI